MADGTPAGPLIYLVSGEESGDRLGAALIAALRARAGPGARFMGVGGEAMAEQGVTSLYSIKDVGSIGIGVLGKLPELLRRIRLTVDAIIAAKPDVLVVIDSPDFTHRIARRVRARAPHIPIVDYVSPSVWAWRPWRARRMRSYIDHILALLPFEPAVHARLGGPACSYVGHPLGEHMTALRPTAAEAARRKADPPVLLVLPGSRSGELRRLLPIFRVAIESVVQQCGPVELVLPTPAHHARAVEAAIADWPMQPRIVTDSAEKFAAFRIARAAVAASGTVTLELALSGVPMVVAYKVSRLEAFIARRLVEVQSVVLANLVLGRNVVPEILQEACTPEALVAALVPLLRETPERQKQVDAFAELDDIMGIGSTQPSARAADVVLSMTGGRSRA